MRETRGHNAPHVAEARTYAAQHRVDLRTVELDVASETSAGAAVERIVADNGRLDVVIHNAGHMAFGPAEAFAQLYDINVLGTQRVNRAALPQLREQGRGLVVWVSSSSAGGGTPPYLAPYFAAKAAMDSLAVSYAGELARWGIETAIIVPGSFTRGTSHYQHAGSPADKARAAEYDSGPYAGLPDEVLKGSLGGNFGVKPGVATIMTKVLSDSQDLFFLDYARCRVEWVRTKGLMMDGRHPKGGKA